MNQSATFVADWTKRLHALRNTVDGLSGFAKQFVGNFYLQQEDIYQRNTSGLVYIALVGVTSSGKSSLMNVLMGVENLFPTQVIPCTSRQVTCSWGDTLSATVHFLEDSKKDPITFTEVDAIRKALFDYGSEANNPQNHKQVDTINLIGPHFLFPKDVLLLDTPGLDAAGLKVHEKTTMELILPSMDMVLFLTNAKADSDRKNLESIDAATSDGKPLIVVQNKIDAISPKVTRDVRRNKSVEQMLNEHRERIRNALQQSKRLSVQQAPIVQISAKKQLNIDKLRRVVETMMDVSKRSRLVLYRRRTVGTVKQLQKDLLQVHQHNLDVIQQCEQHTQVVVDLFARLNKHHLALDTLQESTEYAIIGELLGVVRALTEDLVGTAKNLQMAQQALRNVLPNIGSVPDTDESQRVIRQATTNINAQIKTLFTAVTEKDADFRNEVDRSCHELNIQEDLWKMGLSTSLISNVPHFSQDIKRYIKTIDGGYEIREETVVVQVERHRRKTGFWARAKKIVTGITSWETYTVEEEKKIERKVKCPDVHLCNVQQFVSDWCRKTTESLEKFNENIAFFIRSRKQVLTALQSIVQNRNKSLLHAGAKDLSERDFNIINKALASYIQGWEDVSDEQHPPLADQHWTASLTPYEVPTWALQVFSLANSFSTVVHRRLVLNMMKSSAGLPVYICGWQTDRIEVFCQLFFTGSVPYKILDFSKQNLALSCNVPGLCFLLVNAEQSGSMKRKLFDDDAEGDAWPWQDVNHFLKACAVKGKIVWVMDEVMTAVNAGKEVLAETFCEMMHIAERYMEDRQLYDVLACERRIWYSLLFHELYFNFRTSSGTSVVAKLQSLLKYLNKVCSLSQQERNLIGDIVRAYCKHNNA